MNLALFDIDGTLLSSYKSNKTVHDETFALAIKKVYGLDVDTDDIDLIGKVDKQIILELLEPFNIEHDESKIKKTMDIMAEIYDLLVKKEDFKIHPGVKDVLKHLQEKGVALALSTGNVEGIAWKKIQQAGLDGFFSTGGFGNEAKTRAGVLGMAIKNAEKKFGTRFDKMFNVGDTTEDIKAGKSNNLITIAVATGKTGYSELKMANPRFIFNDMSDYMKVSEVITDGQELL